MMYDEKTTQMYNELRKLSNICLVRCFIDTIFLEKKEYSLDIEQAISSIKSPSELDDILENNGWERYDFEANGWQQDTWYYYSNPNYDFRLIMEYSGFYGGLKLYREDIDD